MLEVGGIRSGDRWPVYAFPVAWVAAGLLARQTLPAGEVFAPIWPAAGVAVLWFLVRGATWRSLDTAVLALVALVVNVITGAPLDTGVVLAAANVAQTLAAVALLRRWCPQLWGCGGDRGFDSVRVVSWALAALALGMLVGAVVGTAGHAALGHAVEPATLPFWLNRNLAGALLIAPLGLLLLRHLDRPAPRPRLIGGRLRALECLAVTAGSLLLYAVNLGEDALPLTFVLPIPTVWVGVRFLPAATALHTSIVGIGTVALTMSGQGRFAVLASPDARTALAQTYLMTLVFVGLALSTRRAENHRLADELRAAERDARFRAGLLDTVIASMREGVAVVDQADRVLVRNPAAERLGYVDVRRSGIHPGFEVFHPDGSWVPPEDRPSQRALRGELVEHQELLLSPAGQGPVLSVTAVPLTADLDEEESRALLMFRDDTDAFARRAELATFAGTVAHDLRNPLSAIEGWSEMLEDEVTAGDVDPALVTSFIHQLRLATGRMHSLIADLLDHAMSGNRRLEVEKVDLREMVVGIAASRGAAELVRCEELPWVTADRVLISQVLDNLIGNALKYVAPGVRPEVVVSGGTAGSGWARVAITDNGIGVPSGEQERIFEEFHRAHSGSGFYAGTGLGLAIVRRIVARHGGEIHARPRSDGRAGSVFEFTLPAYG